MSKKKSKLNPIKALFDGKFDAISGGILKSLPFKFDPGAAISQKSGILADALSPLKDMNLDPFAVGGQILNSKLAVKLGLLNRILNGKKSTLDRVNTVVDGIIEFKETSTRGAIDAAVALVGKNL